MISRIGDSRDSRAVVTKVDELRRCASDRTIRACRVGQDVGVDRKGRLYVDVTCYVEVVTRVLG